MIRPSPVLQDKSSIVWRRRRVGSIEGRRVWENRGKEARLLKKAGNNIGYVKRTKVLSYLHNIVV